MTTATQPAPSGNPKWMTMTGWVLTALPSAMMLMGGVMGLAKPEMASEGLIKFGYPKSLMAALCVVELACVLIYLFPHTAVLGAVLLTGYLGGAVATHARVEDPMWIVPLIVGAVVWLGLFLREPRLRALLPWVR
ncbi:MAG: DoxX family protein [Phycisphaerales bacterium]